MNRIINHTGLFLIGFVLAVVLVLSCTDSGDPPVLVDPNVEHLSGKSFDVVISEYDSIRELHNVYSKHHDNPPNPNVVGFSIRYIRPDGSYYCRVYILRVKTTEDIRLSDLGHEMWHCVAGEFHPKGYVSKGR